MSPRSTNAPLQRSRRDLIVTAIITIVVLTLAAIAWFSAPIRSAELNRAEREHTAVGVPTTPPTQLVELFELADTPVPGVTSPVIASGLLISVNGDTVAAHSPAGTEIWSYTRTDAPLCSLGTAWNKVVATYRTNLGCGDVVALHAATGEYSGTRSAISDEEVVAINSNDRVGVVGEDRLELWRSDMVRTVEYGAVEAKQEPDMQPNEDCRITSALTRTELLAVTEVCPEDPEVTWLRFQETTPEDAREPELTHQVSLPSPNARLVAIGQEAATVYLPGPQPELISLNTEGAETARQSVPEAPGLPLDNAPSAAATADLPHNMSWFDGQRLYLFTPTELRVQHVFDDALGTGVDVGGRLLYPTEEGVAVANWESGEVEYVIPVDRGDYAGPVSLGLYGTTVVEKREGSLVGLGALIGL